MLPTIFAVAFGGAVGSVCRMLLGAAIQGRVGAGFPVGTLVINVAGSLLLGYLLRSNFPASIASVHVRPMLTIGFCGGFTTFSAFSYEALQLVETGRYRPAALYVTLSVLLSLLATAGGMTLARGLSANRLQG